MCVRWCAGIWSWRLKVGGCPGSSGLTSASAHFNLCRPPTGMDGPVRQGWAAVGGEAPWFCLSPVCAKSLQSCPTLCNPTDCSPPGSSVHETLQARILEWVAIFSSTGSSQPRDQTCGSCIAGGFFTSEPLGKPIQASWHWSTRSMALEWLPAALQF